MTWEQSAAVATYLLLLMGLGHNCTNTLLDKSAAVEMAMSVTLMSTVVYVYTIQQVKILTMLYTTVTVREV